MNIAIVLFACLFATVTCDHDDHGDHDDHHEQPAHPTPRVPSECENWRRRATLRPIVGGITPECEADGSFKSLQCHSESFCQCWTEDGRPITQASNKIKACECIREQSHAEAPGAFRPECRENGTYEARQCHQSVGNCWCTDLTGHKLTEPEHNAELVC